MKKTNVPGSQSFGQKLLQFIRNNTVPIMFVLICAIIFPINHYISKKEVNL